MLRKIDAPGIQINEIDRSQYDGMPDYSIVGTTCFICGFADKGENYSIKWINTLQTLVDNYGYPQTEEERYFWNACMEVINSGGICLAARLPYNNEAKDTFPYVQYNISQLHENTTGKYSALTTVDPSLTSYIKITQNVDSAYSGYISLEQYDKYCINESNVPLNTIRIVGIDGMQYGTTDVGRLQDDDINSIVYEKKECLGVMPVLVGATQALFYQQILQNNTSITELTNSWIEVCQPYIEKYHLSVNTYTAGDGIEYSVYATTVDSNESCYISCGNNNAFENIPITCFEAGGEYAITEDEKYVPVKAPNVVIPIDESSNETVENIVYSYAYLESEGTGLSDEVTENIENYTTLVDMNTVQDSSHVFAKGFAFDAMNFDQQLSSRTINDYTVSKIAASYFPTLALTDVSHIDSDQLKLIGVVVFKVMQDPANSQKILFQVQESFVGSLDKNAKNQHGATLFIDDVVNEESKLIRLFSNINKTKSNYVSINENIRSSAYAMTMHERASFYAVEPQVGIILGQYASRCTKNINYQDSIIKPLNLIFETAKDANRWNIDLVVDAGLANIAQAYYSQGNSILDVNGQLLKNMKMTGSQPGWLAVLQKFDNFCKNMRKDCMFLADGLRPFCLDGDQKIVRDTAPQNSIDVNIVPKLKWMTGLNTSYGAGYCDWFRGPDNYSGDMMWIPPSIKAMGIYIYTDAYWQKWDAPAGMNRGIVQKVVDVAFSPNQEQAGKLYVQSWNYACNYPIDGIILEGQKTFQRKKTAFDRVNVRRLFLTLEKQVARIAKYFVYEGNTAWQRERFVDTIRPIFEHAKQRNGILEYYIKCDEDNNTPNVIDNNELRCSIAIKPVKTIEFILLNFICTNQSASVIEEALTT